MLLFTVLSYSPPPAPSLREGEYYNICKTLCACRSFPALFLLRHASSGAASSCLRVPLASCLFLSSLREFGCSFKLPAGGGVRMQLQAARLAYSACGRGIFIFYLLVFLYLCTLYLFFLPFSHPLMPRGHLLSAAGKKAKAGRRAPTGELRLRAGSVLLFAFFSYACLLRGGKFFH